MQISSEAAKGDAPKLSEEQKVSEMHGHLTRIIKSKTLTDEAFTYMALLINEDCPKNDKELNGLLGDFLSDGLAYNDDEGMKLCVTLHKQLMDQSLINVESRDTIIAEKLSAPIMISELVLEGHSGIVKEDDFYDPLLAGEKP